MFGHPWTCAIIRFHVSSFVSIFRHAWSFVVIRGLALSFVVVFCHPYPFVVIRRQSWSFGFIRCHSSPSVVIRSLGFRCHSGYSGHVLSFVVVRYICCLSWSSVFVVFFRCHSLSPMVIHDHSWSFVLFLIIRVIRGHLRSFGGSFGIIQRCPKLKQNHH